MASVHLRPYNPTPERLLACDLVNIKEGCVQHMNSWKAVLERVKVEYLGLISNIQGPEIYSLRSGNSSLRPQVSIINTLKIKKNARAVLIHRLQPSRKVPREQPFGGWTVDTYLGSGQSTGIALGETVKGISTVPRSLGAAIKGLVTKF